jgi:hypothetical protein
MRRPLLLELSIGIAFTVVKAEPDNKVIGKGTTFEKKCRQHRQRHPQQCVTIRVRKTLRSERSPPLATTAADLAPQGQSRFFATLRFHADRRITGHPR